MVILLFVVINPIRGYCSCSLLLALQVRMFIVGIAYCCYVDFGSMGCRVGVFVEVVLFGYVAASWLLLCCCESGGLPEFYALRSGSWQCFCCLGFCLRCFNSWGLVVLGWA